jgi:hypothetical protein
MTQTQQILEHLSHGGSITPLEALQQFGCFRLASRISELRKAGHHIVVERVKDKKANGEPMQYARYSLRKDNEDEK